MKTSWILLLAAVLTCFATSTALSNDDDIRLKPYVLAFTTNGDLHEVVDATREKLQAGNFEIAGEYSPYETAVTIVATNNDLKEIVSASKNGGFGAGIRVAVTRVGDEIQVSYLNMHYIFNLYRMDGDIGKIVQQLEAILGKEKEFGSKDGLTMNKLRDYRYMFGMPYFDDLDELGKFENHEAALQAVERGIVADSADVTKVYRIDVPGKQETVFGIGIKTGDGNDAHVMEIVDQEAIRSTLHLPYEILVSGNKVYSLRGRFRIAASFPDLSMGTFMKIRNAPGGIKDVLKAIFEEK